MANFAVVSPEGIVQNIYYVPDDYINDNFSGLSEKEIIDSFSSWCDDSGEYIVQYFSDGRRQRPAMIGGIYDPTEDKFTDVKPENFPSWILKNGEWFPPIDKPTNSASGWPESDNGLGWVWDEENICWIELPIPEQES